MDQISLEEVDGLWLQIEAAVDATVGIDPWCSGPDWSIPVATGFAPEAERILLTTPAGDGFALLTKYYSAHDAPMLSGLEPLWGFGSPIFGADAAAVGQATAAALAQRGDWRLLYLPGLPMVTEEDGPTNRGLTLSTAAALSALGSVQFSEGITRQVADLGDGLDAWLARRSNRFRRNLRQAAARAEDHGLVIEPAATDRQLFSRLMAIERQSWKGQEGSGITSPEMSIMYRLMIDRLQQRERLLVYIARLDGEDVGYIVGGLRARRYRGLQLSFTERARPLSVGNLLQLHQIEQLDRLGLADVYDLGMDFEYKRRWADRAETSLALIVHRR